MNRVVPLHLAEVFFPPGHPQEGEWGPVRAFLILTPSGALLFDTGVGSGDPEIERWFRPRRTSIRDALARHDVDPADVLAVATSHLHFDHCGENERFPDIPVFVQREEFRAAHEPEYTVVPWVDAPGVRYELLDGEAEPFPGVRLIPTPGHTPGHQSAVVETDVGTVVIAAQAVYTRGEWEGATDGRQSGQPSAWDPAAYAESVRLLRRLGPSSVLFSHDARDWVRGES